MSRLNNLGSFDQNVILEVARMSYGTSQGVKGGTGHIGLLKGTDGKTRIVKFDTHGGVSGGDATKCSNDLRSVLRDITNRSGLSTVEKNKVLEMLGMDSKNAQKPDKPLLSRKITAQVVEKLGGYGVWKMAEAGKDKLYSTARGKGVADYEDVATLAKAGANLRLSNCRIVDDGTERVALTPSQMQDEANREFEAFKEFAKGKGKSFYVRFKADGKTLESAGVYTPWRTEKAKMENNEVRQRFEDCIRGRLKLGADEEIPDIIKNLMDNFDGKGEALSAKEIDSICSAVARYEVSQANLHPASKSESVQEEKVDEEGDDDQSVDEDIQSVDEDVQSVDKEDDDVQSVDKEDDDVQESGEPFVNKIAEWRKTHPKPKQPKPAPPFVYEHIRKEEVLAKKNDVQQEEVKTESAILDEVRKVMSSLKKVPPKKNDIQKEEVPAKKNDVQKEEVPAKKNDIQKIKTGSSILDEVRSVKLKKVPPKKNDIQKEEVPAKEEAVKPQQEKDFLKNVLNAAIGNRFANLNKHKTDDDDDDEVYGVEQEQKEQNQGDTGDSKPGVNLSVPKTGDKNPGVPKPGVNLSVPKTDGKKPGVPKTGGKKPGVPKTDGKKPGVPKPGGKKPDEGEVLSMEEQLKRVKLKKVGKNQKGDVEQSEEKNFLQNALSMALRNRKQGMRLGNEGDEDEDDNDW